MSVVGDPWLRDARNKIYVTFRAARRKFDDAVEEARAGREKGGRNRKEEPPLEVFLWVALLGVLAKVMMRGRPISLKSMQQQQQHASMQPAAATAAAEAARGAVSCCSGALVRVMGVCVHTLHAHAACICRCVCEWMRVHPCVCSQYNSMDVQVQILCVHVCMHNAYACGVCPCVHALYMLTKTQL